MPEFDDLPGFWPQRFGFYRAQGLPSSSPQARAAFKALPFVDRMRLNANFLAFLFGPFYFFAKGMWRKGAALLGVAAVVAALLSALHASDDIKAGTAIGFAAVAMMTANYAYYLQVTRDSRSWNPFEGWSSTTPR